MRGKVWRKCAAWFCVVRVRWGNLSGWNILDGLELEKIWLLQWLFGTWGDVARGDGSFFKDEL